MSDKKLQGWTAWLGVLLCACSQARVAMETAAPAPDAPGRDDAPVVADADPSEGASSGDPGGEQGRERVRDPGGGAAFTPPRAGGEEVPENYDGGFDSGCGLSLDQPALVGLRGSEVWLRWVDGRAEPIVDLATGAHGELGATLLSQRVVPELVVAGPWLLVSLLPNGYAAEPPAGLHLLLNRDGELIWSRTDSARADHLSASGAVVVIRAAGVEVIDTAGESTWLEQGFTPFDAPDSEGFMMGVFGSGGPLSGYGFAHRDGQTTRRLGAELDAGQRSLGRPRAYAGHFYYAVRDADGATAVVREGPDGLRVQALPGLTEDSGFEPSDSHLLVSARGRPLAVIEAESGELVAIEGELVASTTGYESHYADGDYFVSVGGADRPLYQRVFRVHGPSATLDLTPTPALPEGFALFEYSGCYGYTHTRSIDGRMSVALFDRDLGDESPVQLHLEGDGGVGWTPLGLPVVFGTNHSAELHGETWLLTTDDVRHTYCPAPPAGVPSEPREDTLVGRTLQILRPDAAPLVFQSGPHAGDSVPRVTLSPDGRCALLADAQGHTLNDLVTGEQQPLELERTRWFAAK